MIWANMSKLECRMCNHFKKRLWERYGLRTSPADIEGIIQDIQGGKSIESEGAGKGHSMHLIQYKGKEIRVLYSRKFKMLRTCYKPGWVGNRESLWASIK